jgi:outer membrane receptor for ferrienterochelin and colicins
VWCLRHWRACLHFVLAAPVLSAAEVPAEPNPDKFAAMSFEELMQVRIETVYGASKYQQKVTRAPASVTILTAEDIARFGHRTLAEVLRSIRGLYVSDDRNYAYLGTRGFLRPGDYNSRVLVLIDGHRMNDNVYDGAYFGHDGLAAVEAIERVEFVRGPSSSIYGSSAFFGIVNVVTKQGLAISGTEIAAGAGSFGEYDARLTSGGKARNGMEVALNASYYGKSGHDRLYYPEFDPGVSGDSRAASGGIARGRDGEESFGVMASAKHGDLTLSASMISRTKDVPTASFGTVFDRLLRTTDTRGFVDLKYDHSVAADLQLTARVTYDRYTYEGDYPFEYASPGEPSAIVVTKDDTVGTWVGTEWQLTRRLANRHTLVAGFEHRQSLREKQLSYEDIVPRSYLVDADGRGHNTGLYGQGEFALTSKLLLNAGVRVDYYSESFGSTTNPRIGLIYSPRERSTFKLLYGEAFRAPSAYERFYYAQPAGSDELEPETIRTSELVFEQYIGHRDRLNVSVYHYAVGQLVTQLADADDNIYFDNLARVTAQGIELELERRFEHGALARLSYALQRTEDAETERVLSNSPRHLAKLNVGMPLGRGFDAGLELQYHGAVGTLAGGRAAGFFIGNLHVSSGPLWQGSRLSAGLYNLFDARYGYPGAEDHLQDVIEQDGRTFRAELTWRF